MIFYYTIKITLTKKWRAIPKAVFNRASLMIQQAKIHLLTTCHSEQKIILEIWKCLKEWIESKS